MEYKSDLSRLLACVDTVGTPADDEELAIEREFIEKESPAVFKELQVDRDLATEYIDLHKKMILTNLEMITSPENSSLLTRRYVELYLRIDYIHDILIMQRCFNLRRMNNF